MKKQLFIRIGVVLLATCITYGLMAIPAKKRQQRVTLQVTIQDVDLILKALSELPLKESGNLYVAIQQQAQTQLQPPPPKPKVDSTTKKKP